MKFPRLLAVLPLIALAGCNSSGETASNTAATSNTATSEAPKSDYKVALLTPGDVNDQGWNQLAFEGFEGVKTKFGVDGPHQVTKKPSERQAAMRELAEDGTNLIFLHGFEFGNDALALGKKYPDTKFVVVAGRVKQAPNVMSLIPKLEDATYLLGMAAASVTKTNKIGMIGGMKLPVIESTFDAFTRGAKAVNPKIEILAPKYVGDFEDQNKGKEFARALIAQGADVLIHNADQAGRGMFTAAEESTKSGKTVYVFGTNRDQNDLAPDVTLGSAIIEMPDALEDVAENAQKNAFKPELFELNLGNDKIEVEWNDKLKSQIPAAAMKKIDTAEEEIKSGKLKIARRD